MNSNGVWKRKTTLVTCVVKLSILNIRNKMNRLYILVILIVCMACQSSHQTTLKGVIKNYDGALVRIAVQEA